MSSCGKYIFMVGKDDTANLRVVRDMNPWLTKRKVDYEIVEFAGGHTVPYEELKSVIQSHLPDKK